MKDRGRGVIRLGDKTDHDGEIISATGSMVLGKPAALEGDPVRCPRCGDTFPILPNGSNNKCLGRTYAYHGDLTACGAKLISSL